MEPWSTGHRWPGSVVTPPRVTDTTTGTWRASVLLRRGTAAAAVRSERAAGWGFGSWWPPCSPVSSTQWLGTALLEGRRDSQAARLRLETMPRATRGSAALPWRQHTVHMMHGPALSSSTRLGVREPSRESSKRRITTSPIVPSLLGSLALSRWLGRSLVLRVEVRSAVADATALSGSFSDYFVVALTCIRPLRTATLMASPISMDADFLRFPLGP